MTGGTLFTHGTFFYEPFSLIPRFLFKDCISCGLSSAPCLPNHLSSSRNVFSLLLSHECLLLLSPLCLPCENRCLEDVTFREQVSVLGNARCERKCVSPISPSYQTDPPDNDWTPGRAHQCPDPSSDPRVLTRGLRVTRRTSRRAVSRLQTDVEDILILDTGFACRTSSPQCKRSIFQRIDLCVSL